MVYEIDKFPAMSGRFIGEDGKTYNIIDLLQGNSGGGGEGGTQKVEVTNPPKTVGVGEIMTGEVVQGSEDYPKLIAPSGATAIEIQCPKGNTVPLLVANTSMPFGSWEIYPGTSKVFYFNTLYVSLPDDTTDPQQITYMAIAQQ